MPRRVHRLENGGIVPEHRIVYAVVENMPGYLPESDPIWFELKDEAEAYAKEREAELEEDSPYVVDILEETVPFSINAEDLNERQAFHSGAAVVEDVPSGVPAIIGEAGPEAVIPLDDPEAVEVMADAIEESGAASPEAEAVEAAAEATEAAAEAVAAVATSEAIETIAEEGAPEAAAEAVETEAVADAIEAIADSEPEPSHWFFRKLARR